jgi:hypothetical protein
MSPLPARAVIVHSAAHAAAVRTAAAQAKTQVLMLSAPHLATAGGPLYTHALLGDADQYVTPVIDCGDDPGIAWRAAEVGCKCILFSGPDVLLEKVRSALTNQKPSCPPPERASGKTSGHPDPRLRGDDNGRSTIVLTPADLPAAILDLSRTTRGGDTLVTYLAASLQSHPSP